LSPISTITSHLLAVIVNCGEDDYQNVGFVTSTLDQVTWHTVV